MNGLEEQRGILATIWLFLIMMDGALQNGVSADTHNTHHTDTHTYACTVPDRDMLNADFLSGSLSRSHHDPADHVSLSPSFVYQL